MCFTYDQTDTCVNRLTKKRQMVFCGAAWMCGARKDRKQVPYVPGNYKGTSTVGERRPSEFVDSVKITVRETEKCLKG